MLDRCWIEFSEYNVNRYACLIIVGSGFLLWMTIAGRILGRTWNQVFQRRGKRRGKS